MLFLILSKPGLKSGDRFVKVDSVFSVHLDGSGPGVHFVKKNADGPSQIIELIDEFAAVFDPVQGCHT